MEVSYSRCCGLDVHKSSITACVLLAQPCKPLRHIRRFGCTTREVRELVLWLQEFGVEHVAMESTGVYWKPVWNVLESHFQIVLRGTFATGTAAGQLHTPHGPVFGLQHPQTRKASGASTKASLVVPRASVRKRRSES